MKSIDELSENCQLALQLCEDILELLPELPEKAEAFADSVEVKVLRIKQCAENNITSQGELRALENMKAGVRKWIY